MRHEGRLCQWFIDVNGVNPSGPNELPCTAQRILRLWLSDGVISYVNSEPICAAVGSAHGSRHYVLALIERSVGCRISLLPGEIKVSVTAYSSRRRSPSGLQSPVNDLDLIPS